MSRIAMLIAAIAVVVAACSSADATDTVDAPTTTVAITTTTIATEDASGEIVGLVLASTDAGDALATNDGRTVYLFTRDEPDTTTCFDGCLATWPAVPAAADLGYGLDARLVGSIERPDGTVQATYGGWPLYFYTGDQVGGDANGQGFGGVWFLVGADGTAVGEPRGGYGY